MGKLLERKLFFLHASLINYHLSDQMTKILNVVANRGCYFQEGEEVKLKMNVDDAYKRAMETVVNWIQTEVDSNKTQVFFRTFAPVHFRFVPWFKIQPNRFIRFVVECSLAESFVWKQGRRLENRRNMSHGDIA